MKKFFFWGFLITLFACKKEHLYTSGSLEFKIKKPTPSQIFNKSDKIELEFEANSSSEIHGYEWRILQLPEKKQIKIQNEHVHTKNLQRSYTWSPDTLKGFFQFEVKIFPDHDGNYKMDTVNFEIR